MTLAEPRHELQWIAPVASPAPRPHGSRGARAIAAIAESRARVRPRAARGRSYLAGLAYWRWRAGSDEPIPGLGEEPYLLQMAGDWTPRPSAGRRSAAPTKRRSRCRTRAKRARCTGRTAAPLPGRGPSRRDRRSRALRELGEPNVPRGPRARQRTRIPPASPRARWRSSRCWPRGCATPRSPNACLPRRGRSTTTSRRSCASWTSRTASKRSPKPHGSVSPAQPDAAKLGTRGAQHGHASRCGRARPLIASRHVRGPTDSEGHMPRYLIERSFGEGFALPAGARAPTPAAASSSATSSRASRGFIPTSATTAARRSASTTGPARRPSARPRLATASRWIGSPRSACWTPTSTSRNGRSHAQAHTPHPADRDARPVGGGSDRGRQEDLQLHLGGDRVRRSRRATAIPTSAAARSSPVR